MTNNGMPIHPIRTEEDHAAAIARIGELMGAAQDTPAGEELILAPDFRPVLHLADQAWPATGVGCGRAWNRFGQSSTMIGQGAKEIR